MPQAAQPRQLLPGQKDPKDISFPITPSWSYSKSILCSDLDIELLFSCLLALDSLPRCVQSQRLINDCVKLSIA